MVDWIFEFLFINLIILYKDNNLKNWNISIQVEDGRQTSERG